MNFWAEKKYFIYVNKSVLRKRILLKFKLLKLGRTGIIILKCS